MQTPDEIRRDLPSELTSPENEELIATAMRVQSLRPTPTPSFRGDLRRKLLNTRPGEQSTTQRSTRTLVAIFITTGVLLLTTAAIGLAGIGPLG